MTNQFSIKLPDRNNLEVESMEWGTGLEILDSGIVDGLVIQGNWGFNYLGGYSEIISNFVQIPAEALREIVELNPAPEEVIIKLIIKRDRVKNIKAIALVPNSNFKSYEPYDHSSGRASKDFYYNIAYETFNALSEIGCKNIAVGMIAEHHSPQLNNAVAEAMIHAASDNNSIVKFYDLCGNDKGSNYAHGLNFFQENQELIGTHTKISSVTLSQELSMGLLLSKEIKYLFRNPNYTTGIVEKINLLKNINIELGLVILKFKVKGSN